MVTTKEHYIIPPDNEIDWIQHYALPGLEFEITVRGEPKLLLAYVRMKGFAKGVEYWKIYDGYELWTIREDSIVNRQPR